MTDYGYQGKEVIHHSYSFTFKDGKTHNFSLDLSYPELKQVKPSGPGQSPDWTRLAFCRCENCTLDPKLHEFCPAAECLAEIIEKFKDVLSVEEVSVTAQLPERTISKTLPVQKALSSLIGLHLATSNCPILSRFSTLARFHLPFSNTEETVYRAVSNYLLAQYFIAKEGGVPDWELKGLREFYGEVEIVNKGAIRKQCG